MTVRELVDGLRALDTMVTRDAAEWIAADGRGGALSRDVERLPRSEYPKCPRCGGPVAGAMMTSQSVDLGFGNSPRMIYYHPDAISVYCVSGDCNWDHKLAELKTPVPQ